MLPFHDETVIRKNIIAKILFASCSVKILYRENFHAYGIQKYFTMNKFHMKISNSEFPQTMVYIAHMNYYLDFNTMSLYVIIHINCKIG